MEAGESAKGSGRKRTESCGGQSDSDLSDGWNIVDQIEVGSTDQPSSDGESVEIIDPDCDTLEHVAEQETDEAESASEYEIEKQLIRKPDPPPVPTVISEPLVILAERTLHPTAPREEVFDSSFCWFLLFTTSAVIVSNLAFMAAESVIDWNKSGNIYEKSPSFLRDLPVVPKLPSDRFAKRVLGTDKIIVDEKKNEPEYVKLFGKTIGRSESTKTGRGSNDHKHNEQPTLSSNSNNVDMRKFAKMLSDLSVSTEARNRFDQTVLILGGIQVGLRDLEEVVNDNSDLTEVVKQQKQKFSDVLREVEYGVSRSLEKVAIKVLDKVQKLEKLFEDQWCVLETKGHKKELEGLFYDCSMNTEQNFEDYKKDGKYFHKPEHLTPKYNTKNEEKNQGANNYNPYKRKGEPKNQEYSKEYYKTINSGKEHSFWKEGEKQHVKRESFYQTSNHEKEESCGKIANNYSKENSIKYKQEEKFERLEKFYENKDKYFKSFDSDNRQNYENNILKQTEKSRGKDGNVNFDKKTKYESGQNEDSQHGNKNKENVERFKNHENVYEKHNNFKTDKSSKSQKYFEKKDNLKEFEEEKKENYNKMFRNHNYNSNEERGKVYKYDNKKSENHREQFVKGFDKSSIDKLSKYLKANCESNKHPLARDYQRLKDNYRDKLVKSREIFDSIYKKYCKAEKTESSNNNQDHFNKYEYKNEYLKGDFSKKNYKQTLNNWDFDDVEEVDTSKENDRVWESIEPIGNVVESSPKPQQWLFSFTVPFPENKTDVNGEWFIKSGESRSKARWNHHRSDWYFDRASHRQTYPHHYSWLSVKRRNWYFRRAWARHHCRQSPQDSLCHLPEEDTITISHFNF